MAISGGIYLRKNEQVEFQILESYRQGQLTRREAADVLKISERAVTRRAKKVREQGMSGVKHGNYRRPPKNKKEEGFREEIKRLVTLVYYDFNLSHCLEMLKLHHEIDLSYATLHSICQEHGLGKRKKRRPSKARIHRERMANEGLLLQMDGSFHKWNGKDEWCLISVIDDASSELVFTRFFADGETTWNCFKALREIIERKGIPWYIYADKAGWTGNNGKRAHFSQFSRACEELGVTVIPANSPQAKGRIERSFGTTQDRLIPELKLYGIKSLSDANRYLEQCFVPQWNERFTVIASNPVNRYRPLPAHLDLSRIICMKFERNVASDHTVQFGGTRYRITDLRFGSLKRKDVTVTSNETGDLEFLFGHLPIQVEKIIPPRRKWVREAG